MNRATPVAQHDGFGGKHVSQPDGRDFDGTSRGVYGAFLKDTTRMELFGMPARAEGDAEWQLDAFEARLEQLLDGRDHQAAEGILQALRREHGDVTISRAWLGQLRRLHGGTDAAVLLYAAMTGGGIGFNDVDGLGRGADVDISFIGGVLLVEMWIGTRMSIDSDGNVAFEDVPDSLRTALAGMPLSAIVEDDLLRPFEYPVMGCGEGKTLGSAATVDMPDDLIRCGDLGSDDVRPIRSATPK